MKMGRLGAAFGNSMYVDVERYGHRIARWLEEPLHSGLLARLSQSDEERVGLAVGMSPELKPAMKLRVVREEHGLVIRRYDPCGPGDVALETRPEKAVLVHPHELADVIDRNELVRVTLEVAVEQIENRLSVHGRHLGMRPRARLPLEV